MTAVKATINIREEVWEEFKRTVNSRYGGARSLSQVVEEAIRGYNVVELLRESAGDLGLDITTKATKLYVVFKAQSNVVSVVFQRSQLKLFLALPKGTLNDPYNHARDVSDIGHWATGDYEVTIKTNTDLDEIMPLIKQAYQRNQ